MVEKEDLVKYIADRESKGLISLTATYEPMNEDPNFVNTKVVSLYRVSDEKSADELINEAKQNTHFRSVSKKFKDEKVNKDGDIIRPSCYLVTIVYEDDYKEE